MLASSFPVRAVVELDDEEGEGVVLLARLLPLGKLGLDVDDAVKSLVVGRQRPLLVVHQVLQDCTCVNVPLLGHKMSLTWSISM